MAIKQSRISQADFIFGQAQRTPELFGRDYDAGTGGNAWEDFVAARPDLIGTSEFHQGSQSYRDYLAQRLLKGRTLQQLIDDGHRAAGISDPAKQGGSVINPDGTVTMYVDETPDIGETLVPLALSAYLGGVGAFGNPFGGASGAATAEEIAALTGSGVATPGAGISGAVGTGAGMPYSDYLPSVDDWSNWMGDYGNSGEILDPFGRAVTETVTGGNFEFATPEQMLEFEKYMGLEPGIVEKLTKTVGEQGTKSILGSLLGGKGLGAALGGLAGLLGGSKQAGTINTVEDLPEWVKPFALAGLTGMSDAYASTPSRSPVTMAGEDYYGDVIRGDYLNSNPWLDRMFDKAAGKVSGQIAGQFSARGRYGSGAHQGVLGDTLSGLATDIYGGNYQRERGFQNQLAMDSDDFGTASILQPFRRGQALLGGATSVKGGTSSTPYFRNKGAEVLSGILGGSRLFS